GDQLRGWRGRGDGDPAFRPPFRLAGLQCNHIRNRPTGDLVDKCHVTRREQPAVQGVPERDGPAPMGIVKIPCLHPGPIVNRHVESPRAASILSGPGPRSQSLCHSVGPTFVSTPIGTMESSGAKLPTSWIGAFGSVSVQTAKV